MVASQKGEPPNTHVKRTGREAPPLVQDFKPPSPKYDERSFFHDAPRHPYAAGPSAGTPWATPLQGSGLGSGLGLPAGSTSPASGASAPGTRAPVPSSGVGQGAVGAAAVHSTAAQRLQAQAPAAETPAGAAAQQATPPNLHDAAAAQPAAQAAQTPAPQAVQGLPRAPDIPHPKPHEGDPRAAKRARWASQITPPSEAAGAAPRTPVSQAGFRRVVPGKGQGLTLLAVEACPKNLSWLCRDRKLNSLSAREVRLRRVTTGPWQCCILPAVNGTLHLASHQSIMQKMRAHSLRLMLWCPERERRCGGDVAYLKPPVTLVALSWCMHIIN